MLQMKCNQSGCDNPPAFRFTWPGRDEACICAIHALKLRGVAGGIGLYVQLIQLTPDDYIRNDYRETYPADAGKEKRDG